MGTTFDPHRIRTRSGFAVNPAWRRIRTIDGHTAGEPLRLIVDGFPEPEGATILEKRRWVRENQDGLRRSLMWEPRGHADMYGCLLTEPAAEGGDVGVLFMHNEGLSTMCGHGIIGLVKMGFESGIFESEDEEPVVRIDTPAGRVTATAHRAPDGSVREVSFLNVPSFLLQQDLAVEVDGLGQVTCDIAFGGAFYAYVECDIAFGGAFYAYVDADAHDLELGPQTQRQIIDSGMKIKRAVMDQFEITHPDGDGDLNFLYGTIFVSRRCEGAHSRNVCVFAEGEVDRSPTGTGVSGRAAIHHARGDLAVGESIRIESILGTAFDVTTMETTKVGDVPAILPRVAGTAFITGRHEFLIDPEDPLREGFLLR